MIRRQAVIVGLAAGAAALIAIPSAIAASGIHYTIKSGTHTSGSTAYTATTSKIKFYDVHTQTHLGCAGGTASGKLTLGKHVAATKAGTITKTTWKKCTGPGGLVLKPKQVQTWTLNGKGKTNSKGVTHVYVGNVKAVVKASPTPSLCEFTVTGIANGYYRNSTGVLTIKSAKTGKAKLKTSHVKGCLGQVTNGDTVVFQAAYKVKAKDGKVTIKSH